MSISSSSVKTLFDRAIALEPGEKIVLYFTDINSMNSVRTRLFDERTKYSKVFGEEEASSILINRHKIDETKFMLSLTRASAISPPILIKKDGSAEKLDIFVKSPPPFMDYESLLPPDTPQKEETDEERMIRLMREDGIDEATIAATVANYKE